MTLNQFIEMNALAEILDLEASYPQRTYEQMCALTAQAGHLAFDKPAGSPARVLLNATDALQTASWGKRRNSNAGYYRDFARKYLDEYKHLAMTSQAFLTEVSAAVEEELTEPGCLKRSIIIRAHKMLAEMWYYNAQNLGGDFPAEALLSAFSTFRNDRANTKEVRAGWRSVFYPRIVREMYGDEAMDAGNYHFTVEEAAA